MWGRLRGLQWPRETTLYHVACVVLVVAAAVARFHELPSDGLRSDEANAALNARGSFGELIERTRYGNSSPILWPLGLWLIEKIEVSKLSIRLVPALASTLTVAAFVVLLPLAGVRRSVAFLAGVLMAVSVAAIVEARDAREYSIDVLLAVLMMAGALWYLKGEKRWLLPATLFVGPLLQYGLVLLGVAMVLMIVAKQGLDTRWGKGQWMTGFRDIAMRAVAPGVALSVGSATAYFSTLQYQRQGQGGGGWGRDNYLRDDYFSGRLTDAGEIVQFSYEKFRELLDYHIDIIPFSVSIGVIVTSFVLSKYVRRSETTILFLFCMTIAMLAAILRQYPIGAERQSLLWSPVILVAFSQCIPATSEIIARRNMLHTGSVHFILSASAVLITGCIGILAIVNDDGVYPGPRAVEVIISTIEDQRKDGDIILWAKEFPEENYPEIRFNYGGYIPSFYKFCDRMLCMDILLSLQESGRLWLAGYYLGVNDIIISDKIHSIMSSEPLIETKISVGVTRLYFIQDSKTVVDNHKELAETLPIVLDSTGAPVLRREEYEVWRSGNLLVYVTDNCEEERPEFFIHIFPRTLDDLPESMAALQYENQGFFFRNNSLNLEGTCVAVRTLPDYPIFRVLTGQFVNNERMWYGAIDFQDRVSAEIDRTFLSTLGNPVLMNSGWDIYLSDLDIIYVNDDTCEFSVDTPPFFLHVYPVDVGDLPAESQPHGFENRDFYFSDYASELEGGCVVVRSLPTYPVARIETGQYLSETGEKIWKGVIEGEPLAE